MSIPKSNFGEIKNGSGISKPFFFSNWLRPQRHWIHPYGAYPYWAQAGCTSSAIFVGRLRIKGKETVIFCFHFEFCTLHFALCLQFMAYSV